MAVAGMAKIALDDVGPNGQILLLGAHCDDIEIGCGATIVDLASKWPELEFHAIIFCSDAHREDEARQGLTSLLGGDSQLSMHFGGLRDGYLPYQAVEAKEYLSSEVASLVPSLVFTHFRDDLHQDHRFVADITYQVLRDSLVLEMEIPKYDGDMGRPNVFFPVSENAVERKVSTLMENYASQRVKNWYTEETFRSILRLRGLECRSTTAMAEAFYVSKLVISQSAH